MKDIKSLLGKLDSLNTTKVLTESEQVSIAPAQSNTQVIKQGDKVVGTVTNPALAAQLKTAIGKGEMSLNNTNNLNQLQETETEYTEGDRVTVTGDVQMSGQSGTVDALGIGGKFVIVKFDDGSKHSFHSSDLSPEEESDEDDDGFGFMSETSNRKEVLRKNSEYAKSVMEFVQSTAPNVSIEDRLFIMENYATHDGILVESSSADKVSQFEKLYSMSDASTIGKTYTYVCLMLVGDRILPVCPPQTGKLVKSAGNQLTFEKNGSSETYPRSSELSKSISKTFIFSDGQKFKKFATAVALWFDFDVGASPKNPGDQGVSEGEMTEVAAPGQEDWIKANKEKFIKQYGKDKGMSVLYATANKRAKKVQESKINKTMRFKHLMHNPHTEVLWPNAMFESREQGPEIQTFLSTQRELPLPKPGSDCILAMPVYTGKEFTVWYGNAKFETATSDFYVLQTQNGKQRYNKKTHLVFPTKADFEKFITYVNLKFCGTECAFHAEEAPVMENTESDKEYDDFDVWKHAVKSYYPGKKFKFAGRMEGGKQTISAEIPGEDRSYGVWDQDAENGVVLTELDASTYQRYIDKKKQSPAPTKIGQAGKDIINMRRARELKASKVNKDQKQAQGDTRYIEEKQMNSNKIRPTKQKHQEVEESIAKNIKRSFQGWGDGVTPKGIKQRASGYSDDELQGLSASYDDLKKTRSSTALPTDVPKHSPAGFQKRVIDREMKKRGLAGQSEGTTEGQDPLRSREGLNRINKMARAGQIDLRNIPVGNRGGKNAFTAKDREQHPGQLKAAIKKSLGTHNAPVLPESSISGSTDVSPITTKLAKLKAYKSVTESAGASDTLSHILNKFKHEIKQFELGDEIDADLYDALFDYWADAGEIPYGVAKGRDGDPVQWVSDKLSELLLNETQDEGMNMATPDMQFEAWDRELMNLLNEAKKEKKDEMRVGIEAYGVKGVKSTPWRKTFKTREAFEKWLDKTADDVEVQGTRDVELHESALSEGLTVSTSTGGAAGMEDSVTVSATGSDADEIMQILKAAGVGHFGSSKSEEEQEVSAYGAPINPDVAGHEEFGSDYESEEGSGQSSDEEGDDIMDLIKQMFGGASGDVEVELVGDEGHATGDSEECCDDETEELGTDDSDEEESGDEDENKEEVDEAYANEPDTSEADLEYITNTVSGGLNKQKRDQTVGNPTKVSVSESDEGGEKKTDIPPAIARAMKAEGFPLTAEGYKKFTTMRKSEPKKEKEPKQGELFQESLADWLKLSGVKK